MSIWSWFANLFKSLKHNAAEAAVTITEGVKAFAASPVAGVLTTIAGKVLGSGIPAEVLKLINDNINKVLAAELAIVGLPDNPTEQDILDFETRVVTAITGVAPEKWSKFITSFAAQVYGIIKAHVDGKTSLTFAQLVADVEHAWQDYQQDLADNS